MWKPIYFQVSEVTSFSCLVFDNPTIFPFSTVLAIFSLLSMLTFPWDTHQRVHSLSADVVMFGEDRVFRSKLLVLLVFLAFIVNRLLQLILYSSRGFCNTSKLRFRIKHLCGGTPSGSGGFPSKVRNRLFGVFHRKRCAFFSF